MPDKVVLVGPHNEEVRVGVLFRRVVFMPEHFRLLLLNRNFDVMEYVDREGIENLFFE